MSSKHIVLFFLIAVFLEASFANNILHQADSLYLHKKYDQALDHYEQLITSDRFLRQDFGLNFKLAVCYLRNDRVNKAAAILVGKYRCRP